jgi:L-threonylcarbamoyladenylate synthase
LAVTRVLSIDPTAPDKARIAEAASVLQHGGLVAFPTETVYGLGANALDATAVERIFAAKGRPATDPVIVHLASADGMPLVAESVPGVARRLAAQFWPGPLTLILRKLPAVPDSVTAGLATVGLRVPSHPIARALIEAAGVPIAAPSANRFSRPSPTLAEHVLADLDGRIDMVIDGGPTPIGVESTIVDLTVSPPVIRRPGGVSREQIASIVPDVESVSQQLTTVSPQLAPGQLLRHYAPRARTTLYLGSVDAAASRVAEDIRAAVARGDRVGVLAAVEDLAALAPRLAAVGSTGRVVTAPCGSRADRASAAQALFQALRALDSENVDEIYAIASAGEGIDAAIVDRLTRAAEGRVILT